MGDGKGFEEMRDSCFRALTSGVCGQGESSGVIKWQLTLVARVALESSD
jgi:hypothetical protein